MSIHDSNGLVIRLREEDGVVDCREGFDTPKRVSILEEELHYNEAYESYRVLLLDHPLTGNKDASSSNNSPISPRLSNLSVQPEASIRRETLSRTSSIGHFEVEVSVPPLQRTRFAAHQYLYAFPETLIIMRKIDERIADFKTSYHIIPGYESHAAKRVREMVQEFLEWLVAGSPTLRVLYTDTTYERKVEEVVCSYVMGGLYDRLLDVLSEKNQSKDQYLIHLFAHATSTLSFADVGVKSSQQCDLSNAIDVLRCLPEYQSPFAILDVLSETVQVIHESLHEEGYHEPISSDELLSLVSYVIIMACVPKIYTTLDLVDLFAWDVREDRAAHRCYYHLVTFQAAMAFIMESETLARIAGDDTFLLYEEKREKNQKTKEKRRSVRLGSAPTKSRPNRTSRTLHISSSRNRPLRSDPRYRGSDTFHALVSPREASPASPSPPAPLQRGVSVPTTISLHSPHPNRKNKPLGAFLESLANSDDTTGRSK